MTELQPPVLLSVVLPVRNQADHIGTVLKEYLRVLSAGPSSFELVTVPNACTDSSLELCRTLAREDARIRVVENPAGGWGRSVRAGLAACRGEVLCYTNSARTDPAQIPALLECHRRNPTSLVKIARHSRGALLRELGSFLYNLECQLLLGTRVRDVNGTPKLFPRSLLERVSLSSDGDLLDAELLSCCSRLRVRVVELALPGWKRYGGQSMTKLGSARRMYLGALKLAWSSVARPRLQEPRG